MNTARRYLAAEIYRSSALILAALVGLFSFFALVDDLDSLGKSGVRLYHLLLLEGLALPTRIYDILPIGLLIGAILALAALAQRHELVILRVSGISGMRLLGMLWLIAVPVIVLALLLAEWLTPAAEIKLSETRLLLTGHISGGSAGVLSSGYWFKESLPAGERIINIARLAGEGESEGVTLYDFGPDHALLSVTEAERGDFEAGMLELRGVTVTELSPALGSALAAALTPTPQTSPFTAPPVRTEKKAESTVPTTLTPDLLLARVLTPERMSFTSLVNYVRYLDKNHLVSDRQIVAVWRKLLYPVTLLTMVTIAAPLGFLQTRRGGVGLKMFLGILLGVAFFMANQLSLNIGMLNRWPAWLTAIGPNAAALALALLALLAMEYANILAARWHRLKSLIARKPAEST